jgi:hypothetical protein
MILLIDAMHAYKLYFVVFVLTLTLITSTLYVDDSFEKKGKKKKKSSTGGHPNITDALYLCSDNLFANHSDVKNQFVIKYPLHWNINTSLPDHIEIFPRNSSLDLLGCINFDVVKDDAIPYVQIIVENMTSSNESLHKVVNDNILEYNSSEPYIKNVTVDTSSKLGNYSAIEFEYEFKDNGTSMKAMELTSIIDNKTFYFDYVAGQRDYDTIIPQIQEIIRSFEVRND